MVQTDDAQKFAEQIGIQLYETSAKENLNVEEVCCVVWCVCVSVCVCVVGKCQVAGLLASVRVYLW